VNQIRLLLCSYALGVLLIFWQASAVQATGSAIGPPYQSFASSPDNGTCNIYNGQYYSKVCAYSNIQNGFDFLYAAGGSSCGDISCFSVHSSASGYFNYAGPFASLNVPSGLIALFFDQTVNAQGTLSSDSSSAGFARADWIVTYCTGFPCTNQWTRTYAYVFVQVAGNQFLSVNQQYQVNVQLSFPGAGTYSLYGGELTHVDVSPNYGSSSQAYVDFYNVPCSGCFPRNFQVPSIGISY
jgi:hypothetical protein